MHDCNKEGIIATHNEAIETIKKQIDELKGHRKNDVSKIDFLENEVIMEKGTVDRINIFIKEDIPSIRRSFRVIILVTLSLCGMICGYIAYQNNSIVKLQDENRRLILHLVGQEQKRTTGGIYD
jgi:hypothetical protein